MRTFKAYSISFAIAVIFTACTINVGDKEPENQMSDEPTEVQKDGKEYTSAYICPMHCEGSGSEEPGQCPVCGMDYVENSTDSTAH